MKTNNMGYITISLSKEDKEILEKLCEKEKRGKSNMFVVMLHDYIKNKN